MAPATGSPVVEVISRPESVTPPCAAACAGKITARASTARTRGELRPRRTAAGPVVPAECLPGERLAELQRQATELGLHTLIELHDAVHLPRVLDAGGFPDVRVFASGGLDEDHALYEARRCLSCGNCARCPYLAITLDEQGYPHTAPGLCIGCSICAKKCFTGAISMRERTAENLRLTHDFVCGIKLHIVERFTRTDLYTLHYEATITDPRTFSRPWKIAMPLYRRMEPNAEIFEYKCVEFAEPLLYGELLKEPIK